MKVKTHKVKDHYCAARVLSGCSGNIGRKICF